MIEEHDDLTEFARAVAKAFLVRKAGKTKAEVTEMSDEVLAEHALGVCGYGVLSQEMWDLNRDIKRRLAAGLPVDEAECEAVAYAFWSGPISEYYQPKVFA